MSPNSKNAAAAADSAESETGCSEKDVLMGRGKRISEWPGNIYFRQVVNKYRDEYNSSSRKNKVGVAKSVLDDIHAIGGRFVQQNKGDKWEEVELDRAIEKACQALREKEKSRPPETSPFDGKKITKPPKAPPSVRPASNPRRPGRRSSSVESDKKRNGAKQSSTNRNMAKQSKDDESTSTEEDDEELTSADESGNEEGSEVDASSKEEEEEVEDPGMESYGNLPDERAFPLIKAFKEKHGHCAIPSYDCLNLSSKDSEEMALANWCTAQRQLYREIQAKYRKQTKDDTQRIKKLKKLGFCWDYEAWHWAQSFDAVQQEMEQSAESKMGFSDEALEWIQEQRRRGKRAIPPGLSVERTKKLQAVDVLLL
mmetsp:Transcript_13783/g.26442  ORF Transcript_13783/g.26442 Transcript_13783/m.26442 type:complete len:369 (+) Transcript_13783:207-1313(+)